MNPRYPVSTIIIAGSMLGVLLLSGCATTAPKANFSQGMALGSLIASNEQRQGTSRGGANVSVLDAERARIAQLIEAKIAAKKTAILGSGEKKTYEVEVTLTRYEKGSSVARLMLAGLGQIHIDAVVRVYVDPDKRKVGEFTIKKTFAWGGIYGGSTSMEDIEVTFAGGIAAALTGQAE